MNAVGKYLFSIIAISLLISILKTILPSKSVVGSLLKLICGIILATTMISPIYGISLSDVESFYSGVKMDGEVIAEEGSQISKTQLYDSIKDSAVTYIFDKATSLNLSVEAEVFLSDEAIPKPIEVHITGTASPYSKAQLTKTIAKDLAIAEENILWK